jgi:hypothetical protein
MPITFMELTGIPDLINSEGQILVLVDREDTEEPQHEHLYLRGKCLKGKASVYCKVNDISLEIYFLGRISLRELFLLRKDEAYIMEYQGSFKEVHCDETFENGVIGTIECGNEHYYALDKNMRLANPLDEILPVIRRDYINGHISVPANLYYGADWVKDHLE